MIMQKRTWTIIVLALLAAVLVSACGRGGGDPTPTPTKTPVPESGSTGAQATPSTPQPDPDAQSQSAGDPTATPAPTAPTTKTVAVINASVLNVRGSPDTGGELVQTVNDGEEYDVIGRSQDGGWVQIGEDERQLGWVSAEFVILEARDLAAESGEPDEPDETATDGTGGADEANEPADQSPAPSTDDYRDAAMRSPAFGAQAFLWWRSEVADRDLTLMQEANFDWVKQTFAWETIERSGKGQFDWSNADRVVQQVNSNNLKLLARLSTDPELTEFWAGDPRSNAQDFADFAFAVAQRYNCTPDAVGCIQAYQVWNEPNLAREWGFSRPDPAQYAEFLGSTYDAIKRGNPDAIVISAGMAPTGDDDANSMPDVMFYEGMYEAMGGDSDGYFDMLGVHGAGFAAPPELDPAEAAANQDYGGYRFFAFRHVEDIRAVMERYGDGDKKIVLLEFGWTFDPVNPSYSWHGAEAGIDAQVQADYLRRAYEYAADNWQPWIGLMNVLTMPNLDWMDGNPEDEEQYWWAIMEPSQVDELNLRPAFVVLCVYFNNVKGETCRYDPG